MSPPDFVVTPANSDQVASYVARGEHEILVEAALHSRTVFMAFELDAAEHTRRRQQAVGAVRSRGLLHALWEVPEGLPWPWSALEQLDVATLRHQAEGFVTADADAVVRVYRPAGQVRAIASFARRLVDAVAMISELPPIVRRYAIAAQAARTDRDALAAAEELGVGVAVRNADQLRVLAAARVPQVGVPGIYRWWLAEVAYRSWLQRYAH